MARFVFVTWDGGGNQSPMIGLAEALHGRGHEIQFAGYETQRTRFERRGFAFRLLPRSSASLAASTGDPLAAWGRHVAASPEHEHDLAAITDRFECDVLLIDCLMFGALAAAEQGALPAISFNHMAAGTLLEGGWFDDMLLRPINEVRSGLGCPTVTDVWEAWERIPTLCTSIRELDPRSGAAPETFTYVGPIREQPAATSWRSPWNSGDSRPLVLVSFSTFHGFDQRSRLNRTIEGFADRPYRVLITGLPTPLAAMGGQDHMTSTGYIPHEVVLPSTSVIVTHAGHGVVTASLAHGVPLVCLPNVPSDQPGLAAQLERLGAARMLDGDLATPDNIATAVNDVLTNPSYTQAARRLSRAIADASGVSGAVRVLERAAAERRQRDPFSQKRSEAVAPLRYSVNSRVSVRRRIS
jgi:UDP:flavonoid glycosyltransferase YjiC (YdhE family)